MKRFLRLLSIQQVLLKYGLASYIAVTPRLRKLRFFLFLLPQQWKSAQQMPLATRLRNVLEELGPIYVKFGQLLSTRRDLLSSEIASELAMLQDKVPPFPGSKARELIEREIQCPLDQVTLAFDEVPLASGSIAQVHAARLKDGRDYIIKVTRPRIHEQICDDLALIHFLARQSEKYYAQGRSMRLTGVVKEAERTLLNELDLKREAANASQLRRNFRDEPQYYVPEINWELTHDNVLVMERISGIPMNDIAQLRAANIDLQWLSRFAMQIFFTQVFRDNFFHADMHPGNMFVQPATATRPVRLAVVDFGVMSSLTEFDQRYLAENFIAFLNRDYHRVAKLHLESGWISVNTRLDDLEFAVRTVCEPLLDRHVSEISFGEVLRRLFKIAQHFNVEIMPQLLLLQKTLITIEGLCRQLHPDMNLWDIARPQLEQWMKQRVGVKGLLQSTVRHFSNWGDRLPYLPSRALELLDRAHEGKLEMQFRSEDIRNIRRDLRIFYQRIILTMLGCTLLTCAVLLYGFGDTLSPFTTDGPLLASVLTGLSGIVLILSALKNRSYKDK